MVPDTVSVQDVSVYGTGPGFRGHARPGRVFLVDSAWEYSMTREWVLALDIAPSDARKVQEVVDKSSHALGAALDARKIALCFFSEFGGEIRTQHLGKAVNVTERRAQIVGDGVAEGFQVLVQRLKALHLIMDLSAGGIKCVRQNADLILPGLRRRNHLTGSNAARI